MKKINNVLEPYVVNSFDCGCMIVSEFPNGLGCNIIKYCTKHAAARDMHQALKAIVELAPRDKLKLPYAIQVVEIADKALRKAEGK